MINWQVVLLEPAKTVFAQIGQFLMSILLVVIILIIGWIISRLLKTLIIRVSRLIKLDVISERIELTSLLEKGGIKYSFSELIGVIFYWIGLLVTFMVAINAIGLTVAADLLNKVVLYVPNIIAAIFIVVLGMFVATLLKNIVQTAASNAGVAEAKVLAKIVEVIAIVFAIAITLEQLGIGAEVIKLTISIALASLGLSFALAFGLGCRDMAARFMGDLVEKLKKK